MNLNVPHLWEKQVAPAHTERNALHRFNLDYDIHRTTGPAMLQMHVSEHVDPSIINMVRLVAYASP